MSAEDVALAEVCTLAQVIEPDLCKLTQAASNGTITLQAHGARLAASYLALRHHLRTALAPAADIPPAAPPERRRRRAPPG